MTTLNDLDVQQDALVVFIDQHKENQENTIQEWMQKLFDDQQYLYMRKALPTGEELFYFIKNQLAQCNVFLPHNQRLVFCHYLSLSDLTREWVDRFFAQAKKLQQMLPIADMFTHHHVICFSYENVSPLGDRKEEIFEALRMLPVSEPMISREIFLLYAMGFETLDSQEHGLVQMLHLLSRKDYAKTVHPMVSRTWLKMFLYADYYENRATACQQNIQIFSDWLSKENDPGLIHFESAVKMSLNMPVQELRKAVSTFKRRITLYPVNISDFKGNPITGYRSTISDGNPIIKQRREEYIRDFRKEMLEKADLKQVWDVFDDMHDPDYAALTRLLESDDFEKNVLNGIDNKEKSEEIEQLACNICALIRDQVKVRLMHLDEKRSEIKLNLRNNQRELQLAGKYTSLWDCFQKIDSELSFTPISGVFPANTNRVTLISGAAAENWIKQAYDIAGVSQAYRYPDINPYEIVMLKIGDFLNLTDENASEMLNRMLN